MARFLKVLLHGLVMAVYYLTVRFLFIPTSLLLIIGRFIKFREIARKPLVFSDERARGIRDDMAVAIAEGTGRILDHNDYDGLPVSRHTFRREGLKAVSKANSDLTDGEFLASVVIVSLGLLASAISIHPGVANWMNSVFGYVPPRNLRFLSIGTTLLGFLILLSIFLRSALVSHLTFNDAELSRGEIEDLMSKMVWNQIVAQNPAKWLRVYYVLHFAKVIGEETYSKAIEILIDGMDPEITSRESLSKHMGDLIASIFSEMDVVAESSKEDSGISRTQNQETYGGHSTADADDIKDETKDRPDESTRG